MSKIKTTRLSIIIECTSCRTNDHKRSLGVSRYLVSKNKKNTPQKLELKKFCKYCNEHTIHKEIK